MEERERDKKGEEERKRERQRGRGRKKERERGGGDEMEGVDLRRGREGEDGGSLSLFIFVSSYACHPIHAPCMSPGVVLQLKVRISTCICFLIYLPSRNCVLCFVYIVVDR